MRTRTHKGPHRREDLEFGLDELVPGAPVQTASWRRQRIGQMLWEQYVVLRYFRSETKRALATSDIGGERGQ